MKTKLFLCAFVFFITATGIRAAEENAIPDSVTISTLNPVQDVLQINGTKDCEMLSIYSASGSLLLFKKATGSKTALDVSKLPSGMYFLRIGVGIKSEMMPFIKL